MLRYGPAGIPLSCKGRTLKDGIEDVHNLALTALEVQMVRPKTYVRPPDEDEEVGKCIKELTADSEFVVGIRRPVGDWLDEEGDGAEELRNEILYSPFIYDMEYFDFIYDPSEIIEPFDDLIVIPAGISFYFNELYTLGNMARRHDVKLSLHTPYYMDLGSDLGSEDVTEAMLAAQNVHTVIQAGVILNALGGDIVVTNVGLYDDKKRSREQTEENIRNNLREIRDWWGRLGLTLRLGIEVTGQQDVFGSLEQITDLCEEIEGITPVLNFAHYQARYKGALNTMTDFVELLNRFAPYCKDGIYASFSNVEFTPEGNEKWLTPLKKGELRFERLAEALADIKPEITLISSSPLLEHDAVYMRTLTERVLSKKAAKILKDRKKLEHEAVTAEE